MRSINMQDVHSHNSHKSTWKIRIGREVPPGTPDIPGKGGKSVFLSTNLRHGLRKTWDMKNIHW